MAAGLSRAAAKVDLWLKEVAPSDALRRWFNHDPERWPEFRKSYRAELAENSDGLETLRRLAAGKKPVTLLFAAKDSKHNNAVVLKERLSARRRGSGAKKQPASARRSRARLRHARTSKHS